MSFPEGKQFAFSIFDDTDVATLEYIRPIYALLEELGFRTTKSVWPLPYLGASDYSGSDTLWDPAYASYVRELQERGFEIAFHGARMETSERALIIQAFDHYKTTLGQFPGTYAAHGYNRDNLYWGANRFHFRMWRLLYSALGGRREWRGDGHQPGSPYFWGDLAESHLKYMRSFTYDELNLWKVTTAVPYRTADAAIVRGFFPASFADNVEEFIELLSPERQARLEHEQGLAIVGTHFGKGFLLDGQVHPGVVEVLTMLSKRPGWFKPVATVLDYLVAQDGPPPVLHGYDLFRLEALWFWHSVHKRYMQRTYKKTQAHYLRLANERRATSSS